MKNMSSLQRVALSAACLVVIIVGLVLAVLNWPMTREITYVQCDAIAKTCSTIVRPYKVGNEGAVLFGIFLIVFGLIVLSLLLAYYVKYMFLMMTAGLKKLAKKLAGRR